MRQTSSLVALVAMVMMLAFASCGNSVDPIHGTQPVDTTFYSGVSAGTRFPLDEFKRLGARNDTAAQRKLVDKYRKQLTANVVAHYPAIKDEKNIKFVLGSGFAKDVKSGDGKTYSGEFKNELIIIINDAEVKDTVFLACGNGMLSPLSFSNYSEFGTAERWRFEIQKGEGLANYLPELQKWASVAKELEIPIKDKTGKVVGSEVFSKYLGKYESLLFTGDVIDLLEGKVYNKSGQEVQFDRRMQETKKANQAIAKAAQKAKAKKAKAKKAKEKKRKVRK